MALYICEIIMCSKLNGKSVFGLKIGGDVVLTSVSHARIFCACFNLYYSNKNI